jgi:DNA polymerase III subunit delta
MAQDTPSIEVLQSSVARGEFSPVYLLHGEEDFLIDEATDVIVRGALTPDQHGFNLDVVYGNDSDARDIVAHASSFPMMADRRVVVVRDLDGLKNKELLTSYIETPLASTSLILQSAKPDFRRKPFTAAKKGGKVYKFDPIRDYQIANWIGRRAKQQRREIEADATKLLAAYVNTSLREIQNELDKLYLYASGKRVITADDVRAVVGVSKEYNVFALQNAIGARNMARATHILSHQLSAGESPILIIVMLTRYFVLLWKLQDMRRRKVPDPASQLGIHPSFFQDYVSASGNFSPAEIEQIFGLLATADEQLKSTSIPPAQILQTLVIHLAGGASIVAA